MIIGIDGNEANVIQKVGVSVYTLQLLYGFQKRAKKDLKFIVFLKNKPLSDLPKETPFFSYRIIKGPLWSQVFLPLFLFINTYFEQEKISVFFSPAHYAPRFCPIPTVVTIHDLSYFYYPQEFLKKDLYKLKNWTNYSIQNADRIIAVSKTTKKDIMEHYKVDDKKIHVVYNGYGKRKLAKKTKMSSLVTSLEKKKFILYVGTLQPRKNITTLIYSFSEFIKTTPQYSLVIAGKKGWLYDSIFKLVQQLNLNKHIIFTDYISDLELSFLYKSAFCMVLPSYYEGFGIPILEAFSFKCPVISSFSSSLPEIGGDACLYFDPQKPQSLTEKLIEIHNDASLRNNLIIKGIARSSLFSWNTCTDETLQILLDTSI